MPILNVQLVQVGEVGIQPQVAYLLTNDTLAEVTANGYLNKYQANNPGVLNDTTMCLVTTKTSESAVSTQLGWFEVAYDSSTKDWSLLSGAAPGSVTLPTIANHLAVFTNTTGNLADDVATAIQGGNLQAGLSGTAGYLASFPSTAASGSFRVAAVANSGDTLTTLSNVSMGQASVISIPDPVNAVGRLLVGATATPFVSGNLIAASGTGGLMVDSGKSAASLPSFSSPSTAGRMAVFTNTSGNIGNPSSAAINAGNIQAGLSGTAGYLASFPSAASQGSFRFQAVANAGNFISTVQSDPGQIIDSTYILPASAQGTAYILVSEGYIPQALYLTPTTLTDAVFTLTGNTLFSSGTAITNGSGGCYYGYVQGVNNSGGIISAVKGRIEGTDLSATGEVYGLLGEIALSGEINGGTMAATVRGIWNDAGTATDLTSCRGFAFTNAGTNVLNSQLYMLGGATYAFELDSNVGVAGATYVATPAGSTPSGNLRTLKVRIDGADYFILAAAVYS